MELLKDSGNRRAFETGAVRDMAEGKGRCDLLPACAILRLARHYEAGAVKYESRNWEKGIPVSCMLDSGIRHMLKYLDGQKDEDHLAAAAWNILGAMWMEEKRPDLQDIPSRKAKPSLSTMDLGDSEEDFIEWLKGKRYLIDEKSDHMTATYEKEHKWELAQNCLIQEILNKLKED